MTTLTAKECARQIIETCFDAYENMSADNMTEKQAYDFCVEHIEFIIGTNGSTEYLWEVEKQAIDELKLNIAY